MMQGTITLPQPIPPERMERLFPTLSPAQLARMAKHGKPRPIAKGDILLEPGDQGVRIYAVKEGRLEIVRPEQGEEIPITTLGPGQFTGEVGVLAGRRSLVRIRATEPGSLIEIDRDSLLRIVQTESDLGDILMRALIYRRVELINQGLGSVVLIGSRHCAGTLRVKEFLTRNGQPYKYIDLDSDPDVQKMLEQFDAGPEDIPVLLCDGNVVLRTPTNHQIAECLGFNASIDPSQVRDVVIIGAGPSGLAAAVYAASEGLDVMVLESGSPGGQAGSSSKIENYLGFPLGISGQDLAARAFTQAEKFGARVAVAREAMRLGCARKPFAVTMENGPDVRARTVIIATGAAYRRLKVENLAAFEGVGVYYGATFIEAQLCKGEEVVVVGGGNSAGQAAVFLAQTAKRVHMLVRRDDLSSTMSMYLIRRIEQSPNITLRTGTEIVALEGGHHLERVTWKNRTTGETQTRDIGHLFSMTGADPCTRWLADCVSLDPKGFIKTGSDLTREDLVASKWPLDRAPHLLETSIPGVFAVGDVRCGNLKRVAPAVGEGSIAVAFVHQVLHE